MPRKPIAGPSRASVAEELRIGQSGVKKLIDAGLIRRSGPRLNPEDVAALSARRNLPVTPGTLLVQLGAWRFTDEDWRTEMGWKVDMSPDAMLNAVRGTWAISETAAERVTTIVGILSGVAVACVETTGPGELIAPGYYRWPGTLATIYQGAPVDTWRTAPRRGPLAYMPLHVD